MKKHQIIISILMSLFIISCSQGTKKTTAKLKLNLSSITNLSSGIGSGGAILFGKSSTGEQFGKVVSAIEQDIELANGDWSFYAVMWEKNSTFPNLNDTVYCGKSAQVLSGAAATISMNLSNSNCATGEFSNGTHYVDGLSKVRFPDFYLEECDELSASASSTCKRDNQGSALSYRMTFKNYTKLPSGALTFNNDVIFSQCVAAEGGTTIFGQGTKLNFPTSNSAMPFVISAEMFLGSNDCGTSAVDLKGMFTHLFADGIAANSTAINKLVNSPAAICTTGPGTKEACEDNFGAWTVGPPGTCSLSQPMFAAFLPQAECAGATSVFNAKYLKQMVAIPKDFLCRNTNFNLTGGDVFPGGSGSLIRPYKICSEWQLNQIGEIHFSNSSLGTKSYKLMNNLDMNNADFNVAARPVCVGAAGSIYKKHHNLNPIGQVTRNGCLIADKNNSGASFTGSFNGNNKTISHARINVEIPNVGFVRELGTGGVIKNLSFKNLQVEGEDSVGGVAGIVNGTNALISNVKIFGGDIDTQGTHAGGIAAQVVSTNKIIDVQVRNLNIHAGSKVGGLVAINNGSIERSMFRGRISQHTSLDTHVGGLVGEAGNDSMITASFSEGEIDSAAKWTGGIAGINAGSILNSYSSMYVSSRYGIVNDPSANIGGIVGGNESGIIASVYFDGALTYKGSTSSTFDAIAAFPSNGTLATCTTSTPALPSTNVYCSSKDLRSAAVSEFIGNSAWKYDIAGTLPRLSWEFERSTRSCLLADNLLSVSAQVAAGKGTYILPVIICNASQLKTLSGTPQNRYIKLGDDINLASWLTEADLIQTFSGILDGQGYALYGAMVSNSAAGNTGLFVNNTGTLSNLKIIGNSFNQSNSGATGVLAGVNSGVIKNIFMMENSLIANSYVGQVVGSNSVGGLVRDVFIQTGSILGDSYVGGIAGSNEGTISHASVNTLLSDKGTSPFKFGGITGYNGVAGKVDQSVFSGNINPTYPVLNSTPTYFGGLVGYNSGVIENSMTKNYTRMNVVNANSVGGLVGLNNTGAILRKSFSLGKLTYAGAVPAASNFGPVSGVNAGSITDTLYLENTTGGFIGQAISTVCNQSNIDFTTAAPAYLTVAAPGADLIESKNFPFVGNALRNYMSFDIPSTDHVIAYNNDSTCTNGDAFNFYKSYDPAAAGKTVMDFSTPGTFSGFDLAMESATPGVALNVDRLIAYYKSEMYGTVPALTPPIWELDENDHHPRLLQVRD